MANEINRDLVIGQAEYIRELSVHLNREIVNLENLVAKIKNEWNGPASDAFQNQLRMLIADMKATKSNMINVSSTIKDVASTL